MNFEKTLHKSCTLNRNVKVKVKKSITKQNRQLFIHFFEIKRSKRFERIRVSLGNVEK